MRRSIGLYYIRIRLKNQYKIDDEVRFDFARLYI